MVHSAFAFSTFMKNEEQASKMSYGIILVLMMVDSIFSNSDFCLKLFYNSKSMSNAAVMFWVRTMEYMPSFTFSMAFGTVATRASPRFSFQTMSYTKGEKFGKDKYYYGKTYKIDTTGDMITQPSTAYMVNHFYTQLWVLVIIWWYFDHILSSNRGAPLPPYFLFTKSYWKSIFP